MKKLLFLALAAALVAGSAFAMTDPAFSGEFEYYNAFNFDQKEVESGDSGDAKINLNGIVDEWSTVNAEIENDDLTYLDDPLDLTSTSTTTVMVLNRFSLTTDLTGALGLESPVGVTITWGGFTYEPATYAEKAGYEDLGFGEETATYIGLQVDFDFMGVAQFNVVLWPGTWAADTGWTENSPATTSAVAMELLVPGIAGVFDINAYWTMDKDSAINEIGTTMGLTLAGFEFGLGSEIFLNGSAQYAAAGDKVEMDLGAAFGWALGDMLGLGFAFGTAELINNFAASSVIAFNIVFTAVTGLDLYGSINLRDFTNIAVGYEAGIQAALGGTTYTIGWSDRSEFKTPDWTYDPAPRNTLYLKVSAEY